MEVVFDSSLSPPTRDTVYIRPTAGWINAGTLRDIWRYRDLLSALAVRDIRLRYRQTVLGAIWVVLQPLMAAGIFSIVFGHMTRNASNGLPYFLFSFTGLLAWNIFSGSLSRTSGSLLGNSQLVSKVYFPRLILPLSAVFSTLVDFGVGFVLFLVLMTAYRVSPSAAILLLPVWLLLLLLLGTGVGLFASALSVSYRDVQYVLPVLTNFLLFASPVPYSLTSALAATPERFHCFFLLNPTTGLLEAFRWSLFGTTPPSAGLLAYSTLFSVFAFVAGMIAFKRMERRFADVI